MADKKVTKEHIARFGRIVTLLLNRATMYQSTHPYILQALDEFYKTLEQLLETLSPLVFILNRDQFFLDEEPVDPRINVTKIVMHFKKAGIQSISFERGLDKNEVTAFMEIFTNPKKYPNAEAMKKGLQAKNVQYLRINHVVYKKVTADDEVVSREALKKITPEMMDADEEKSKKLFIDALLESVLSEEFVKTINIQNIMHNPAGLSKRMIEADLSPSRKGPAEEHKPGSILVHQLQLIDQEVEKHLAGEGEAELPDLAMSIFQLKNQLLSGIEAQKIVGVAYANEEKILNKANEITDKVLMHLLKEEYKSGKITTERMAQILRRLIPQAQEMKRLLPKIKAALLEEGMPLTEYRRLLQELEKELQNEELVKLLKESSAEIGLESEDLIKELKADPVQAAELLYLAGEIRKGTGDERLLTDLLVNYVERLGSKMTKDLTGKDEDKGADHLRQVMGGIESRIIKHLKGLDVKDEVLQRLEERLNTRMDSILDNLRMDWLRSQGKTSGGGGGQVEKLSVLQTLERNVTPKDELGEILKIIRVKVESREIDENDFEQIYAEIAKQKQIRDEIESQRKKPVGILSQENLMFLIGKEISRTKRYDIPCSALGFTLVRTKADQEAPAEEITPQFLMETVMARVAAILRETDIVGHLGKNDMLALLPMTNLAEAKIALRRALKLINTEALEIRSVKFKIQITGVAVFFDSKRTPHVAALVKSLSAELEEMAARVKNIHALF
ncbi:MAG: hypothetical protein EHM45_12730 [Desulfobacteraceae bacterium]|nr:MAG: hypothetical protein EHM45_12730 [Desulfobacteraceae bacterium]